MLPIQNSGLRFSAFQASLHRLFCRSSATSVDAGTRPGVCGRAATSS